MIEIKGKTIIHLSEQTVRELLSAIDKAKQKTTFIATSYPKGDVDEETKIRLDRERGKILVESEYLKDKFIIRLETTPHTQESAGYRLHENKTTERFTKLTMGKRNDKR